MLGSALELEVCKFIYACGIVAALSLLWDMILGIFMNFDPVDGAAGLSFWVCKFEGGLLVDVTSRIAMCKFVSLCQSLAASYNSAF